MMKLYQFTWLGINFKDLKINKFFKKRADEKFYQIFYQTLFNKYESLNDLPKTWLKHKINIAKFILKFAKKKN